MMLQESHQQFPPPLSSPLLPRQLIDLFIRPRKWFSEQVGALGKAPYLIFVTWCYGISSVISRIDKEIIRAELGRPRPSWEQLGPMITESWSGFWLWVFIFGAGGGLFFWWLGGWWYRVRLQWSGAHDPNKRLARLVLVYSSFVHSFPMVVLALVQTGVYSSYAHAFSSDELYSSLVLIFPVWSLITSYLGVRTLFQTSRWKTRIGFLILPSLFYIMTFGLLVTLFALFGE